MDDGPWGHKRVRHDLVTKQQQISALKKYLLNPLLFFFFFIEIELIYNIVLVSGV